MTKKKKNKDNGTLARPMVLYKNYDYVDNDLNGPGEGLYNGEMDKYKSVDDFKKKTRKRLKKIRNAFLQAEVVKQIVASEAKMTEAYDTILKNIKQTNLDECFSQLVEKVGNLLDLHAELKEDQNNLSDPTENTITPIPLAPKDVNPIGIDDGIWPLAEFQEKPSGNLYYGKLDGPWSADDKIEEEKE